MHHLARAAAFASIVQRGCASCFSLRPAALLIFAIALLVLLPKIAIAASIDVGQALSGGLADTLNAVVTALVTALIGWVLYIVKNKFNIEIEQGNRDAIEAFVKRQAASLVADGLVKVQGVKIDVTNEALAAAANLALSHIPDALKFFNLTPASIQQRIVDALPHIPSVAQAQAVALDVANPATPSAAPPKAA